MFMDEFLLKPWVKMFYLLHNTTTFLLILCIVFALTSSISSQPAYAIRSCLDQSNETANTDYKSNLTVLLESLSSKAPKTTASTPKALILDVSNETCQICLSYATQISQLGVHLINLQLYGTINAC